MERVSRSSSERRARGAGSRSRPSKPTASVTTLKRASRPVTTAARSSCRLRELTIVLLWYAAGSVFAVWNVFQSAGLDFRAVALGALLPLAIDLPARHQAYAHALVAPVAALALVMLATSGRGRKLARRRWIGLPIGWFCG